MTLFDDRGRLFGRWNVVDALIGVVLLGLIPLLYGGYVLFRTQEASLVAIEPARIVAPGNVDVTIRGTNLRPYMRVSFDHHQGRSFLFADTTKAVVGTADLPPGVYDVILYDMAQERARIPKGLEVLAPPRPDTRLDLIGTFTALTEAQAAEIKDGLEVAGLGPVLRAGARRPAQTLTTVAGGVLLQVPSQNAFNVNAIVRANCVLTQRGGAVTCTALETALMEDNVIAVTLQSGRAFFQIDQIRTPAASAPVTVRARFGGDRSLLERMRAGDRDARNNNELTGGATIASLDAVRGASPSLAIAVAPPGATNPPQVAMDLASREVVLRLEAQRIDAFFYYGGRQLAVGNPMVFNGPGYQVSGTVLSVSPK
ncbi:MAG: DUF4330 domain-containing protein [Cyanobacteria bacterium]|nr:DUF4330 domain-containing protein [Cyanobacteriota bacterium]